MTSAGFTEALDTLTVWAAAPVPTFLTLLMALPPDIVDVAGSDEYVLVGFSAAFFSFLTFSGFTFSALTFSFLTFSGLTASVFLGVTSTETFFLFLEIFSTFGAGSSVVIGALATILSLPSNEECATPSSTSSSSNISSSPNFSGLFHAGTDELLNASLALSCISAFGT